MAQEYSEISDELLISLVLQLPNDYLNENCFNIALSL